MINAYLDEYMIVPRYIYKNMVIMDGQDQTDITISPPVSVMRSAGIRYYLVSP